LVQLRKPAVIVACQVSVSLKNPRVVLNAVAFGNDSDARFERLPIEGPSGRDDRD
jgi:hypothetical protein